MSIEIKIVRGMGDQKSELDQVISGEGAIDTLVEAEAALNLLDGYQGDQIRTSEGTYSRERLTDIKNRATAAMESEIEGLITKSLGEPDPAYPSRQLRVSNEFIKNHPEFEAHRVEVYIAYVKVYARMKEQGRSLRTLERSVSNPEARELLRKPPSTKTARPPADDREKLLRLLSDEKFRESVRRLLPPNKLNRGWRNRSLRD